MSLVTNPQPAHAQVLELNGLKYHVARPGEVDAAGGAGRLWNSLTVGDQDPAQVEQEKREMFLHFHEGAGYTFEGIEHTYELARGWDASAPGKISSWPRLVSGESVTTDDYKGWLARHPEGYLYLGRGRYVAKYPLDDVEASAWNQVGAAHDLGSGNAVAGQMAVVNGQLLVPVVKLSDGSLQPMEIMTAVGSPDTWDAGVDTELTARHFCVWGHRVVMAQATNEIRLADAASDLGDEGNWAPSMSGAGYAVGEPGTRITALTVFGPYLVVWKEDGPWYFDEDLRAKPGIPELAGERDEQNGVGVGYANAALLAPHRGGLVRWVPDGPYARVGPEAEGGLDASRTPGWGRATGTASYGGWTFVTVNDALNGVASLVGLLPPRARRVPYAPHIFQQVEGASFEDVEIVPGQGQPVTVPTPQTWADDDAVGDVAWENVTNALLQDGAYATAGEGNSHYLKGLALGLAVPSSATITGVTVEVVRRVRG